MSKKEHSNSIIIENISKHYINLSASLKVKVISNFDFKINESEIILLTGPNGSGKSTLLKMIAGLVRPTTGKISVCGYNPLKRERAFLKLIGFIPENCRFHAGNSGFDFLLYIGKLLGIKEVKEQINERVEFFGLKKWITKDVGVYSSGMRQRLALCAATLNEPRVLLLDEPLINLDSTMKTKLIDYLTNFAKNKNIVILASHKEDYVDYHKKIEFPIQGDM